MPDYEKMYHLLFNTITDALTQLEAQNYGDVKDALISAQQKAEEKAYRTESGSVCAGNGSGVRRFDRCL